MQNEGKGGKCYHSRHACAHRWGWAVRVSVAASGTTAAKKSAVS